MRPLTDVQQKILQFIKARAAGGLPPSVREICQEVGLKSTSSVHAHLTTLEKRGLIDRNPGQSRAILTGESAMQVPILGRVTAGAPILAVEEVEGYIPVSAQRHQGKELFALNVRGDSMMNAGILDGDIVICEKTPAVRQGEIVVALIEDEATVKRLFVEGDHYRLQPENDAYEPILATEIIVLGRVVSSYREY